MRILQVSTSDLAGGAEGSAWNLFQAYRKRGHDSWLAVGHKRSNDSDVLEIPNDEYRNHWARLCLAVGSPLQPLRGKVRGAGRLYNILRWIGEPQRWLDRQRGVEDFQFPGTRHLLDLTPKPPDIVHCHNLHGNYFDLRALPWLSHRVPVILNLRDAWLLSGHCAHSFDCNRWRTGCGRCPDLTIYPPVKRDATDYNWQRKRDIFQQSRLYITTPSQWLMNKVKRSMLRGIQYRVILNAIDLRVFHPGNQVQARKALGLPTEAQIILLSAHNMFKDYDMMEAALRQLDKEGAGKLIFVCLGKQGADKVVGEGRMIYPGFERNPQRVALYYHAADLFIHAAKDEAFGKTVTEAMACGVPAVATAVGGITEQIEDGKTGFLVPPGDSSAMATAIKRLLADADLRASMGQAGVAAARCRYSLQRQSEAFLSWYQEILGDWKQVAK